MTKPEMGVKRTCQTCNARFYDMERSPIICPKCGDEVIPKGPFADPADVPVLPTDEAPAKPKRVVDGEELDLDDVDLNDFELDIDNPAADDNDVMEDMSELENDDDDMSEVMEHLDPLDER